MHGFINVKTARSFSGSWYLTHLRSGHNVTTLYCRPLS